MLHRQMKKKCDNNASNGKNKYNYIDLWKGGLKPSVAPSPPQSPNSSLSFSISECDDAQGRKLSMNFVDIQASHYNNEILLHI